MPQETSRPRCARCHSAMLDVSQVRNAAPQFKCGNPECLSMSRLAEQIAGATVPARPTEDAAAPEGEGSAAPVPPPKSTVLFLAAIAALRAEQDERTDRMIRRFQAYR